LTLTVDVVDVFKRLLHKETSLILCKCKRSPRVYLRTWMMDVVNYNQTKRKWCTIFVYKYA